MRTLIIVSNMGAKLIKLQDAIITTSAELKTAINKYNREHKSSEIDFNQVSMVVGGSNVSLDLDSAQIPEGDQRIFLMQKESKAGSTREEAYSIISRLIAKNGDHARNHFNDGINYTNKRTSLLWELIDSYVSPEGTATTTSDLQQYLSELEDLVLSFGSESEVEAFNNLKVAAGLGDPAAIALARELKEEYCEIAAQSKVFVKCED